MDDSELVPPSRLSMTDEELEAAVEQAKSSPDGLIAAIVLLEQQAQLRAQDDANFAAFAARNQPQNQPDAAPQPAAEEPEFEPVFEPAPASQSTSEFDAILGSAIEDAGDEVFSDTDFSVTGTLQQIVERVNEDFSQPQEELAPELDEQEITAAISASPAPISAFAVADQDRSGRTADLAQGSEALAAAQKTKTPLHLGSFFDSMLPSATAATTAIFVTMLARTESPVTSSRFYGLLLGMILATVFGLLTSKANQLAGEHLNLVSRSTFGVWGAALPATGVLVFKLVALAALVLALASPLWRAFNLYSPLEAGALRPALWPELAVVAIALAFAVLLARFSWLGRWVFGVSTLGFFVVAIANFKASTFAASFYMFDMVSTAVQTALIYLLVQLAFGFVRPLKPRGTNLRAADYVAANVFIPSLFAAVFFASTSVSQQWFPVSALITLLSAIAAFALMVRSTAETAELLFVKPVWARLTMVVLLVAVATYLVGQYLVSVPLLLLVVAVPASAAVFATLADQVARRAKVHEVSLVRGYGFYGRVSAINIVGFVLSTLVGLALCPGFTWSAQTEAFAFMGAMTAPVASGLVAFLYTVTVSRIRVERQESEVMKVERRKNELAGIDEIVDLP